MVASAVLTTLEQLLHKIKANRRREMGQKMTIMVRQLNEFYMQIF